MAVAKTMAAMQTVMIVVRSGKDVSGETASRVVEDDGGGGEGDEGGRQVAVDRLGSYPDGVVDGGGSVSRLGLLGERVNGVAGALFGVCGRFFPGGSVVGDEDCVVGG